MRSRQLVDLSAAVFGLVRRAPFAPGDRARCPDALWLRRYQLDELHPSSNAVAGDMSLVGPRSKFVDSCDTEDCGVLRFMPCMMRADWIAIPSQSELLDKAEYAERYDLEEMVPRKTVLAEASPPLRNMALCG